MAVIPGGVVVVPEAETGASPPASSREVMFFPPIDSFVTLAWAKRELDRVRAEEALVADKSKLGAL